MARTKQTSKRNLAAHGHPVSLDVGEEEEGAWGDNSDFEDSQTSQGASSPEAAVECQRQWLAMIQRGTLVGVELSFNDPQATPKIDEIQRREAMDQLPISMAMRFTFGDEKFSQEPRQYLAIRLYDSPNNLKESVGRPSVVWNFIVIRIRNVETGEWRDLDDNLPWEEQGVQASAVPLQLECLADVIGGEVANEGTMISRGCFTSVAQPPMPPCCMQVRLHA